MATTIPASTNTTIATCVQIQNGDMTIHRLLTRTGQEPAPVRADATIV